MTDERRAYLLIELDICLSSTCQAHNGLLLRIEAFVEKEVGTALNFREASAEE
jgi:hypothetical protein